MSRRAALALYAAVTAATVAWVALVPGEPHYAGEGAGSLAVAAVIGVVVVALLAFARAVGWYVAFALDLLALGASAVVLAGGEPKALGTLALEALALLVLLRTPLSRVSSARAVSRV